jgi:hypothetical protein
MKTALITVLTHCTCGATRWFHCSCASVVAEYDAPLFDGIEGCPSPAAVAYVESQHPGHPLRYVGFGQIHADQVAAARAQLAGK